MMDERSVRQILLARYYLHLAAEQLESATEPAKFAGLNLCHEALETILICCADHLNANVPEKSTIQIYLDRINQKLNGNDLPFRSRVLQFNKARVAAKHHLTLPDETFLRVMRTVIPEFVRAAVSLAFKRNIEEVSLVDLVKDLEIADYLRQAEGHLASGEFYECLTACRKAFYVQFEKQSDIGKFADPQEAAQRGFFSQFSMCDAPAYAKNIDYVRQRVTKPSDYIVLDHSALDAKLMKQGIDVQTFWNIWRLTPEMYRNLDGTWSVEYDFDLAEDPQIKENCTYVLDSLVSITLQREIHEARSKSRSGAYRYIQTVPEAILYRKASQTSEVIGKLPEGVRRVNISRAVPSLDGEGSYWEASYIRKGGPFLMGFLKAEDAEGEPQTGFVADGTDIRNAIPGRLEDEARI